MKQVGGERRWWKRYGGTCLLTAMAVGSVSAAFAAGLNDTGQTTCYDNTSAVSPEPSTHPRQDCTVGRDAAAVDGILPKIGAGNKGFDFTKIANDGSELPADAVLGPDPSQWACTRDNLTGLIWEVKTNDGSLRDMNWTYTWYDNIHTNNNGGNSGSVCYLRNGACIDTCGGTLLNSECNTQAYVAAVNVAKLCGQNDWRLPTRGELQGLVDNSIPPPGPSIDDVYFPNTFQSVYESSSSRAYDPAHIWGVIFVQGFVFAIKKSSDFYVRLVRVGQ